MKRVLSFLLLLTLLVGSLGAAAGPGRGFGGGGFRSSSSFSRSYSSPSFSRSYSRSGGLFSRPSTPSYSRPSSSPTIIHHHYSGGSHGGGLGVMDYFMLNSIMNNNQPATTVVQVPAPAGQVAPTTTAPPVSQSGQDVAYQTPEEESHWFRNTVGFLVIGAGLFFGIRYLAKTRE